MLVDAGRAELTDASTRRDVPRLQFAHKIVLVSALPWAVVVVGLVLDRGLGFLNIPLIYLGTPHVLMTAALFVDPGLRNHVRANRTFYVAAPVITIVGCVAIFLFSPRNVVGIAILGLTLWQIHHFTKQNLGIFSFWTKSKGMASPSSAERRMLQWTAVIGMAGIMRSAGRTGWIPTSTLVEDVARGVGLLAIVVLTVAATAITLGTGRARRVRLLGLLTTVAFFAPVVVFEVGFITAALTYQAAHGAQYYLMVGTATRPTRRSGMAALILLFVAGLLLLTFAKVDPYGTQAWMFGLYKGVVAWHFVADSRLWRLRDAEIRGFMKQRFTFL